LFHANCHYTIRRRRVYTYLHKICGTPVIAVAHSTHNPHLIPIFSLCFCRARSAIDCDANWTYASPEARPWSSANRAIPLGTICIPVTHTSTHKISPLTQHTFHNNYCTQYTAGTSRLALADIVATLADFYHLCLQCSFAKMHYINITHYSTVCNVHYILAIFHHGNHSPRTMKLFPVWLPLSNDSQGHRTWPRPRLSRLRSDLLINGKYKVKDIQHKPESLCICAANLCTLYQRVWLSDTTTFIAKPRTVKCVLEAKDMSLRTPSLPLSMHWRHYCHNTCDLRSSEDYLFVHLQKHFSNMLIKLQIRFSAETVSKYAVYLDFYIYIYTYIMTWTLLVVSWPLVNLQDKCSVTRLDSTCSASQCHLSSTIVDQLISYT